MNENETDKLFRAAKDLLAESGRILDEAQRFHTSAGWMLVGAVIVFIAALIVSL